MLCLSQSEGLSPQGLCAGCKSLQAIQQEENQETGIVLSLRININGSTETPMTAVLTEIQQNWKG